MVCHLFYQKGTELPYVMLFNLWLYEKCPIYIYPWCKPCNCCRSAIFFMCFVIFGECWKGSLSMSKIRCCSGTILMIFGLWFFYCLPNDSWFFLKIGEVAPWSSISLIQLYAIPLFWTGLRIPIIVRKFNYLLIVECCLLFVNKTLVWWCSYESLGFMTPSYFLILTLLIKFSYKIDKYYNLLVGIIIY